MREETITSGEILTELGAITGNALSQAGRWLISSVVEPAFATTGAVLSLFVPSQLGDGTLDSYLANKKNVRLNPYVDEKGKTQVAGISANDSQYNGQVKEVQAQRSGQNFVIDLDNGITLTWSPDGSTQVLSPETISTADNELDVENIWVKPVEEYEHEHGTVLYPEEDLDEYLVTFPADSGYPPLYLVFSHRTRLPRNNGDWVGEPGNGEWYSNKPEVLKVTKGKPVVFKDGYPDFGPWSKANLEYANLDGTNGDFDVVYEDIAAKKNLNSKTAAKRYLSEAGLTPHHHQDKVTIQLVPTDLHGNIPHNGGASLLRKEK